MAVKSDPVKQVKSLLAEEDCPQYLLVISPDEVRRKRIVQLFLDRFQKTGAARPGELLKIDGSVLNAEKIASLRGEMFSVSLFSPTRYFHITKLEEADAKLTKELLTAFEDLPADIRILVTVKSLPATHGLRKFFQKAGQVIALEELNGFELKRWIQKELRQQGVAGWTEDVVEQIAVLCEEDPDKIVPVVEQLALYLDSGESLSAQKLHQMYGQHKDPSEFVLLDLLSKGQRWKAELTLTQLLQGGKNPFALLALLTKSFSRQLVIAWHLERGAKPAEIRSRLGLAPWLFQKHMDTAQRYSAAKLKDCLFATLAADARLKNHSLGPEAIFSELAGRLSV